jgi:hypothetical protein
VIVRLAIDKADFKKGKPARALSDRILEFLAKNSDKAYLQDDITTEMMREDAVLQELTTVGRQAGVLAALDNLVRDGEVVARIFYKMPSTCSLFPMAHSHQAQDSQVLGLGDTTARHHPAQSRR